MQIDTNDKIAMIKSLRTLTKVLGKLGVSRLVRESWMWHENAKLARLNPSKQLVNVERYSYGLGLKEAKDLTEGFLNRKARSAAT